MKDKEFFNVTKEERKKAKGIKGTLALIKKTGYNKKYIFVLSCITILAIVGNVFSALISKEIFGVFSSLEYSRLYMLAVYFLIFEVFLYGLDYAYSYTYEKFNKEIHLRSKNIVYNRILSMKASCFLTNQTSTFTHRLGEAPTIVEFFSLIFKTVRRLGISVAYCIILFTTSPILASITTAFYLVKTICYRFILPKHNVISRKLYKIKDKAGNIALESIRGASDVKSLNFSDSLSKDYNASQEDFAKKAFSLRFWFINRIVSTNLIGYALNAFVLIMMIGYFMENHILEAGAVLFFWSYRGHINNLFNTIFDTIDQLPKIEVNASRVMELYDEKTYPIETFGEKTIENFEGNIKFKNVSFSYVKGRPILKNVSFNIDANKITAIVGKTGCGKSTTLSLIARFYDTNKGKITIDGTDVKDLTKECLRNNIGYVQQNPYIFNRTFKENLLLVNPNATDKEIIEACKKSEIHEFIMDTKDKYDTLIGENGITLSGGQRQRLAIARALLSNSKIIMFDESTSSLDNENQAKIQATIENLSSDHTIIVVAHRLSTIINADKIIFMENHQVKAEGTHDELFKNCEEYRELYEIESTKSTNAE